jgi:hypothetical protein
MARTTHDRLNDHFGEDQDSNIVLGSSTSSYPAGELLHDVLADLDSRLSASGDTGTVNFVIAGTTGVKGDLELGFSGTWTAVRLFADQTGSIVVDIWKDTYANFPPTDADSITASAQPTISTNVKSEDTTLTGWDTGFLAGDILRVNVDSVTSITQATMSLTFARAASRSRSFSDSVTTSDVVSRTGTFGRTGSDTVTISDAAVAVVT